jgi:hypothetical protein
MILRLRIRRKWKVLSRVGDNSECVLEFRCQFVITLGRVNGSAVWIGCSQHAQYLGIWLTMLRQARNVCKIKWLKFPHASQLIWKLIFRWACKSRGTGGLRPSLYPSLWIMGPLEGLEFSLFREGLYPATQRNCNCDEYPTSANSISSFRHCLKLP